MNTAIIPFHDSAIYAFRDDDGGVFIAIRPVCEHLGVDPYTQTKKLSENEDFELAAYPVNSKDGKTYEMMCLPQEQLLGWLYTINSSKVKRETRPILKAYKAETTDAINNYWTKGVASNPRVTQRPDFEQLERLANLTAVAIENKAGQLRTEFRAELSTFEANMPITGEQTGPIKKAVRDLAQKMGGKPHHFRQAWRTLYDRYGIAAYRDLPRHKYDEALEFVAGLARAYGGDRLL